MVFHLLLVGVAWEVDVLPLPRLLRILILSLSRRVERLLLIELVKPRDVFVVLDLGLERRLAVPEVLPVDALEERVLLDFIDPIRTEPIIHIAHESPEQVLCLVAQIGVIRNDESLLPLQDLLASDGRLIGEERRVTNEHLK